MTSFFKTGLAEDETLICRHKEADTETAAELHCEYSDVIGGGYCAAKTLKMNCIGLKEMGFESGFNASLML